MTRHIFKNNSKKKKRKKIIHQIIQTYKPKRQKSMQIAETNVEERPENLGKKKKDNASAPAPRTDMVFFFFTWFET